MRGELAANFEHLEKERGRPDYLLRALEMHTDRRHVRGVEKGFAFFMFIS
jgi:hypothetical protein